MRRILLAVVIAAAFAAEAAAAAPRCPAGLRPATTAEVFFGQDIAGGGEVSDADWRGFLSAEVSPRFPDGLTVADVYGQWRGPKGSFVREPSKALFIVLGHRSGAYGEFRSARLCDLRSSAPCRRGRTGDAGGGLVGRPGV